MGASTGGRALRAMIMFGLVSAALFVVGAGRASAAACESWGGLPPNAGSGDNELLGVAATSPCNAWAVGHYFNSNDNNQTLVEHWNGKEWRIQRSQNPGGALNDNSLLGVAATSPRNAWAVGYYYNGTADQTLIEHWNGKTWRVQSSQNPGGSANENELAGVAAISPSNAWAVGYYDDGTAYHTLVEHWNGKQWTVQSSPSNAGSKHVEGVFLRTGPPIALTRIAATSSGNAWAVGWRTNATGFFHTLVEHWNGKAWKVQASRSPGGSGSSDRLLGVAATSSANAWAVGDYSKSGGLARTLIERWNGKRWKVQPSPSGAAGEATVLDGVAATSPTNAWAVGDYVSMTNLPPLIERWNGTAWKLEPSTGLNESVLYGVAAISSNDAWTVGYYNDGTAQQTLALHCC